MEIDLSVFLAAVIEDAGGEVRIPFGTFTALQEGEATKALTFDIEDDGATLVLGLADNLPEDLEDFDE